MTDTPKPIINADLDFDRLNKELDKVKTRVFLGRNASFLGSLMCSLNFTWTSDIQTACTNGISLWWNPYLFMKQDAKTNETMLIHELWHPAELDMLRRGNRDPYRWNIAADIRINNRLSRQGYYMGGFPWCMDLTYPEGISAEEIYEDLEKKDQEAWDEMLKNWEPDLIEPDDLSTADEMNIIGKVVKASQVAQMAGEDLPGDVQKILKQFLTPKIPWEQMFYRFFDTHLNEYSYSLRRPNRRYPDDYMPSLLPDEGLVHIMCFMDVSGSILDGYKVRFNSEMKYVKETFNPETFTLAQFDTRISRVDVFTDNDPFEEIMIHGGGGTSLRPVREYIMEHKPTLVVIFSDLECAPMEPLVGHDCPILWVTINNPAVKPSFGEQFHIKE
ncbi:putative metallopeptidase domain-containing protein [Rhizobium phage RHph_X2_28B]|uniref:HNH endonuclease n=1 Tax=Rhizobium phage RHph_X2_28B TaxID=2836086 RepID=UPI00232951D8|nr:HNH endonuclease [Rhizobium phage RHph_X2_28B]QWY83492.1 putative metallopeptidase domain-containing protein [Rhizobium phage RHph_X2_28B]QWY83728.1 putative metallopeptidase domain-containing protein [Rhizobium phage RHph_X3_15]